MSDFQTFAALVRTGVGATMEVRTQARNQYEAQQTFQSTYGDNMSSVAYWVQPPYVDNYQPDYNADPCGRWGW